MALSSTDIFSATQRIQPSHLTKIALIYSYFASSVFVLQLEGILSGSNLWTTIGFVLYPVVRLKFGGSAKTDIAYLASVIVPISGVMAYGAQMPMGYSDVHAHLETVRTTWDGRVLDTSPDNPSVDFIGLYLFTVTVSQLFNTDIATAAQYLPVILLSITAILYFGLFSRDILSSQFAILATLAFILQYGVYRFGVEFRTLGLALPLVVLLFYLSISNRGQYRTRYSLLSVIIIFGFVIVHFSSLLMVIFGLASVTLVDQIYSDESDSTALLLILGLSAYIYMEYISGGLQLTVLSLVMESLLPLAYSGAAEGTGSSGSGAASTPIVRWLVRLVFVASASIVGWRWLRGQKDKPTVVLFALCGVFGTFTIAAILGFEIILNPGRFMTFFAIPYGVIFAAGLQMKSNEKWRSRGHTVLILIICILIFLNPVSTIPSDIIGATEPVRDSDFNEQPSYTLDEQDQAASKFTSETHISIRNIEEIPWGYYRWKADYDRQGLTLQYTNCDSGIYSNGKITICR